MYFSVWTHAHYSNTSSPIWLHRSHRSQREHICCLILPTQGNCCDKMKSAEFIAISIWLSHFRKKSSIWSRAKWNLGRESAPTTRSSTVCQLWSVSILHFQSPSHPTWVLHLLSPFFFIRPPLPTICSCQTLLTENIYRPAVTSEKIQTNVLHSAPFSTTSCLV